MDRKMSSNLDPLIDLTIKIAEDEGRKKGFVFGFVAGVV